MSGHGRQTFPPWGEFRELHNTCISDPSYLNTVPNMEKIYPTIMEEYVNTDILIAIQICWIDGHTGTFHIFPDSALAEQGIITVQLLVMGSPLK